jgi:predicted DsbA family dithiol-disulfide isomerase
MAHAHSHKVQVYHATAPTCHWSWGFEPVFNRLRLVYGNQIGIQTMTLCVWENFTEYMKEYEMKWAEFNPWLQEIKETIGLPVASPLKRSQVPFNVMPASLGAMAAYRQGEEKGQRFVRAILRKSCVEGQDASAAKPIHDAAREAGLNLPRFERDLRNKAAREAEYGGQGHGWPELPLSYYTVAISDGHRHVLLEHAFDPAVVEGAIDYMAGGKLRKRKPSDIIGYLQRHGASPTREIERVFALSAWQATKKLRSLKKAGKVEEVKLAGAPHWAAANRP